MKRRQFLTAATLAAAPAAMAQAPMPMGDKPAIKITDIKTFLVGTGSRNWIYVKVETDQGISGIGEAYSVGPDEATVKVIEDYKLWLVGHDPRNVQYLWDLMYNTTRFPGGSVVNSAISGIEHALWDIAGKAAGLPVWALLNGRVRDKVRVYQSAGGASPQAVAESAQRLVETHGYTAIKMSPHNPDDNAMPYNKVTRIAGQRVGAVRKALGPDVDIAVDIHAHFFEVQRAIRVAKEIEQYYPFWLEEPIRPENYEVMKKLSDHVDIPLASGEANYTKYEFRDLINAQALDIVQPDICCCGGMLELKKIAAMAEAQYIMVAPHNPMSPLATAVNVHFAASTPNFLILEYRAPVDGAHKDVLKEPIMVRDGYVDIPTKPGWGVELNEEAFQHMPPSPWKRPTGRRADGSIAFL
ncbi:MAG: galactonate dehydratase [Acidobacteria bacterium]|nr:galactonate dehydratase [Acidobacteriota bacterium]MDA1236105.1 galactonate dehydratase [Acidobacteriota bacterium]